MALHAFLTIFTPEIVTRESRDDVLHECLGKALRQWVRSILHTTGALAVTTSEASAGPHAHAR